MRSISVQIWDFIQPVSVQDQMLNLNPNVSLESESLHPKHEDEFWIYNRIKDQASLAEFQFFFANIQQSSEKLAIFFSSSFSSRTTYLQDRPVKEQSQQLHKVKMHIAILLLNPNNVWQNKWLFWIDATV